MAIPPIIPPPPVAIEPPPRAASVALIAALPCKLAIAVPVEAVPNKDTRLIVAPDATVPVNTPENKTLLIVLSEKSELCIS